MKAQFHVSGQKEVEVQSIPGNGVSVNFYDLSDYETRKVEFQFAFGKHEARAIASAMMGCAAEL